MELTIITPFDDDLQVWELYLTEEEFGEFAERYGHRGASVLVDKDKIGEEIQDIYK